jgi:hypothetical protein
MRSAIKNKFFSDKLRPIFTKGVNDFVIKTAVNTNII